MKRPYLHRTYNVGGAKCAINKFIYNVPGSSKCSKEKINQGKEIKSTRNGIARRHL